MRSAAASGWRTSVRLAFGLSSLPRPGLTLLLLGIALGPHGLGVITDSVLLTLQPAMSLALATLGVLVGLEFRRRAPRGGHTAVAAGIQSLTTFAFVAAGMVLVRASMPDSPPIPIVVAAVLGACAAASSTIGGAAAPAWILRLRAGDLHDALPIVIAAAALAWTPQGSSAEAVRAAAQAFVEPVLLGAALAGAGWLLVSAAASEREQRAFTIGTLLLLGGAAAYLSFSALFAGVVAGLIWNLVRGPVREHLERDVRHLQQPLTVLLLVLAGAWLAPSRAALSLGTAYLALRIAGKLTGGWLASLATRGLPADLGAYLVAPGIVGLALAVDVTHGGMAAEQAATLLGIVIAGSLGSELVALVVPAPERRG